MTAWRRCPYVLTVVVHAPCQCGLPAHHRNPGHVCPHGEEAGIWVPREVPVITGEEGGPL